jgi:hypothetical protein
MIFSWYDLLAARYRIPANCPNRLSAEQLVALLRQMEASVAPAQAAKISNAQQRHSINQCSRCHTIEK